jgi:HB1/ASXL restriction endonuclease-like protein with HTH domain
MIEEMVSGNPYDLVLSDLKAKRAQIDQAIAVIEGLRTSSTVVIETDKVKIGEVLPEMFAGMTMADAARKLLFLQKKPLTTPEILQGLIAGGIVFRGKAPGNVVGSVLHRQSNTTRDIVSVARGKWGLKEWYPNQSFGSFKVTRPRKTPPKVNGDMSKNETSASESHFEPVDDVPLARARRRGPSHP